MGKKLFLGCRPNFELQDSWLVNGARVPKLKAHPGLGMGLKCTMGCCCERTWPRRPYCCDQRQWRWMMLNANVQACLVFNPLHGPTVDKKTPKFKLSVGQS